MKKHKKHRQTQRLALRREELVAILERAKTAPLGQPDFETLLGAVDTLAFVTQELEAKGASLQRLRNMLFGSPTEKTEKIFDDKKGANADPTTKRAEGKTESKEKAPGHGRNSATSYTGAKKKPVAHPSLKKRDRCPECKKGKVYPMAEPATLVRIFGMAPLDATVYELERLRCNLCGEIFTAPAPEGVGNEKYDDSAAAMIGSLKYGAGFPFHRLERLQRGMGIPLPAATQWEIVEGAAEKLEPAFDELIHQGAQGRVLHNDDTTARILEWMTSDDQDADDEAAALGAPRDRPDNDAEKTKRTGVYTSGIVSVADDHRVALFFTGHQHAGENLADVLSRRSKVLSDPIQMCDALAANTSPAMATILANCLSHGRRQFVDIANNFPEACRHVLESLRGVYRNDEIAKKRAMTDEERLAFHQAESGPPMQALEAWMQRQLDEHLVEPHSGLGEAIRYMQRHWKKLTLFLRKPGAPLDNNVCERVLKKAILHRKNSYFYRTEHGAHVGDVFMSLIHTAELCGIEPFPYLVALLRHHEAMAQTPSAWMPWNYKATLATMETTISHLA
jgi:transposase